MLNLWKNISTELLWYNFCHNLEVTKCEVSGVKKMMGPYESNNTPFTIYDFKIVIKVMSLNLL